MQENLQNWLSIGQSFVENAEKSPKTQPNRGNRSNYLGEDLQEQAKKFFNVEKRRVAADFIDEEVLNYEENTEKQVIFKANREFSHVFPYILRIPHRFSEFSLEIRCFRLFFVVFFLFFLFFPGNSLFFVRLLGNRPETPRNPWKSQEIC